MNIFKILSTAHGKVYEPSITAFVAYLLNPYENHGLKNEFLKLFLSKIIEENKDKLDFLREENEKKEWDFKDELSIEVLTEQSFDAEEEESFSSTIEKQESIETKEEIVDIIIAFYEKITTKQRQYDAEKKLKVVFLIENKIRKDAENEEQLFRQYKNSYQFFRKTYQEDMPLIFTLFLSVSTGNVSEKFSKQYQYFIDHIEGDVKPVNLFWNPNIIGIITDILENEANGRIEPIYDYTKHTLKSFLNFIKSDFRAKSIIGNTKLSKGIEKHEITERIKNNTDINLFETIYDFLTLNFEGLYPRLSDSFLRVSFVTRHTSGTPIQLDLRHKVIKIGIKTDKSPSNDWESDKTGFQRINIDSIKKFELYRDELSNSLKQILPK